LRLFQGLRGFLNTIFWNWGFVEVMWGLFPYVYVAFIKPKAAEAFWPQSAPDATRGEANLFRCKHSECTTTWCLGQFLEYTNRNLRSPRFPLLFMRYLNPFTLYVHLSGHLFKNSPKLQFNFKLYLVWNKKLLRPYNY
jgi:hypothetical protein